jgi:hypothetical protein
MVVGRLGSMEVGMLGGMGVGMLGGMGVRMLGGTGVGRFTRRNALRLKRNFDHLIQFNKLIFKFLN